MIYFLLPVYNEEDNIAALVGSLRAKMAPGDYRIVAVDDGSRDASAAILARLAGDAGDLEVVGSQVNMNIGAVFSSGINAVLQRAADEDIVIILESDQTSEIELVPVMADKIREGRDVVIASRYRPGGRYVNFPLRRRIFSSVVNQLLRRCFPIEGARDYTIFFRAYRAGLLREAVRWFGSGGLIQSKGFVANAELLVKLSWLGARVGEVPFIYDYGRKKGQSKIRVLRTFHEYFSALGYLRELRGKVRARRAEGALPEEAAV